jgi:hypothetical protein
LEGLVDKIVSFEIYLSRVIILLGRNVAFSEDLWWSFERTVTDLRRLR